MGSAMTVGLVMGGLSALGSYAQSEAQAQNTKRQMQSQAKMYEAQAKVARNQAEQQRLQGEIDAKQIERNKIKLREAYEKSQSHNRSMLSAGNVDMTSGSALDVSLGNINNFAADVADNAYAKALKEWETLANVNTLNNQANNYDAQASYSRKLASRQNSSWLPSLLTAAISGAGGFAGGYTMAGGSLSSLFDDGISSTAVSKASTAAVANATKTPVSQLTQAMPGGGTLWGHPSGKGALLKIK